MLHTGPFLPTSAIKESEEMLHKSICVPKNKRETAQKKKSFFNSNTN